MHKIVWFSMDLIHKSYGAVIEDNEKKWNIDALSAVAKNAEETIWDQLAICLLEKNAETSEQSLVKKRTRLDLETKKKIVLQYYKFCEITPAKNQDDDADSSETPSLRSFVTYNNTQTNHRRLELSSLSRWIRAEKRGEYQTWEKQLMNVGNRKISCPKKIVKYLDSTLKKRDKYHGVFNKIVRSPSLVGEYGVVARRFTPAGTFLGYYKGEVITGVENDTRNHNYTFKIGKNKFIDASEFLSCFARYYNCSLKSTEQNVCVELLTDWTNPQKAVCFIANIDIKKGDEFLISYGPEYWEATASNLPARSPFRKVCNTLSGKNCILENIEPLYSLDAHSMAADFGDDKSVSSDNGDSDYCD